MEKNFDEIVATAPVVWTDARLQALLEAVVIAVPYVDDAIPVMERAGLALADLPMGGSARRLWHAAFDRAATLLRLPTLVEEAAKASPMLAARIDELRAERPPLPAALPDQPASGDYKGFSDRARRERQIVQGMPTLLDVRFLAVGVERAKAVCRIEATFTRAVASSTGFRIGPTSILTNHHCVFDEDHGDEPAATVQLQFRHEMGIDGKPLIPVTFNGRAGPHLRGGRADDWAVVEVDGALPDDIPVLAIDGPGEPIKVDDRVSIIQHPKGMPKKVALQHNLVRWADDTVVQYWTDTDAGSSGAPVFNDQWEVVALHHAEVELGSGDEYGFRNQGRTIERIARLVGGEAV